MQEVYKTIGRIAPQDVTVLVLGESGTGKELVARSLHEHKPARRRSFSGDQLRGDSGTVAGKASCSATRREAFTGADKLRPGKFEQAGGGTLFSR